MNFNGHGLSGRPGTKFCFVPMDGGGITGLRLFCSDLLGGDHSRSEKKIEFPGSFGNWGLKIVCENDRWAEKFWLQFGAIEPHEYLGVVRIRLSCNQKGGSALIFGGHTEDPLYWQHGLENRHITKSENELDVEIITTTHYNQKKKLVRGVGFGYQILVKVWNKNYKHN